ncbi:MAG: fibronectin type III domain-containing protein, partial [Methanohalophilus sp.]
METGFKILLIGLMIIGMGCGVAAAESAPNVTSHSVADIDTNNATVNFDVNQSDASTRIAYSTSSDLSSPSWSDWDNSTSDSRSISFSGLSEGTTYHYSVYAHNGTNDSLVFNTTIDSFATFSPTAPSISDISSSDIGGDRATINYVVNQSDAPTRIA